MEASTCLYLIDDAAQVAVGNVGGDHDFTLHILAADRVRTCHGADFRDIVQRDFLSVARIDHQVTYLFHCRRLSSFTRTVRSKLFPIVIHLGYGFAPQHDIDILLKLRQRDAILCHHFPLGCNDKLRTLNLLFHVQVGNAGNVLVWPLYLIAQSEHAVQVVAEQLDGDIRLSYPRAWRRYGG